MLLRLAAIAFAVTVPAVAAADDAREGAAGRNFVNLRAGASTNTEHVELCGEVAPLPWLSVEGCGTGSGFLHADADPEVAHFRAKARLASWRARGLDWQPLVGVGFAELQLDEDAAGFQFTGTDGKSTAGAEASVGLRAVLPAGRGFEFVGELSLSLAYLPHAPELAVPHDALQPTAIFTLGVGY